jgi:hypothetical protein
MTIKLKNKSEISVTTSVSYFSEYNCKWCGKTIKKDKPRFFSSSTYDYYCSAAHVKAAANAAL